MSSSIVSHPRDVGSYSTGKRAFDLVVSVVVIAVTVPIWIIIALAIKFADGGPILYRGRRVGIAGQVFVMYKFRSMVVDAEKIGSSSTSAIDPRLTGVGRVIRRRKLDELPQLLNVLLGDMSIVGPRPQVEWDVARYDETERRLLTVRPGLTDWSSIRFRNEGEILAAEADPDDAYDRLIRPEKIRLGLRYVDAASLGTDLRIIGQTIKALLGFEVDLRDRSD